MTFNTLTFIVVACFVVAVYAISQRKFGLMNVAIIIAFFAVLGMFVQVFL